MTDKHESGQNDQDAKPSENNHVEDVMNTDPDVIELSDIAIGISPEDDAIVELTEEVIGEALNGFAGAVREVMQEDEEFLDLSEDETIASEDDQEKEEQESVPDESDEPIELKTEDIEEDLSKELDDYFEAEEEAEDEKEEMPEPSFPSEESEPDATDKLTDEKISVSDKDIEAVVEQVIHKMYSEKINRLIDEMIEKKVSNEVDRLKEHLINALKK